MRKLLISALCLLLVSCASTPCHKQKTPELILEYGFLDCGVKKIEHQNKVKEFKVFCITENDKTKLENWMIFWTDGGKE